jgi:hypothetical protein
VAVVGCDDSEGQRRTLAAPAASSVQGRDLSLSRRLPSPYRRVCAEHAADAPAGARVCPPLVPEGPVKVLAAGPFSKRQPYRGGYLADFSSSSLARPGDERVEATHWHYDVSWTPAVRRAQVRDRVTQPVNASEASACRQLDIDGQRAEACRVVPYERGGGLHGGHIAYVWTHGRVTYVVSLHGYANEPRAKR